MDYVIERSNDDIAVLNIHPIGSGLSYKPSAVDVTIGSNAHVIAQLIDELAAGRYQQTALINVILVSYSLGTLVAWTAASNANYNCHIRGLIATGEFLFYRTSDVDPDVITMGEVSTIALALAPSVSLSIPRKIPIFVVIGEYDFVFCQSNDAHLSCKNAPSIQEREQSFYASRAGSQSELAHECPRSVSTSSELDAKPHFRSNRSLHFM